MQQRSRGGDSHDWVRVVAAPLAANIVYWFWLSRDFPPLEALGSLIFIFLVMFTGVALFLLAFNRGPHPLLAILIAFAGAPVMLVACAFLTIGGAFFLGELFGDVAR